MGMHWHFTASVYSYGMDRSSSQWALWHRAGQPHEIELLKVSGWRKFWFSHNKSDAHICISSFCKCVISGNPSSPDQGVEEWKINQVMQNVLDTAIRSFSSYKKRHTAFIRLATETKNCFNILWHLRPRVFNIYSHHRHLYRNFSYKFNYQVQMQPLCAFSF